MSRVSVSRSSAWLLIGVCLVMSLPLGCGDSPQPPPAELRGVWRTDAPRYRDRYFEVREDALLFGIGNYQPASHYLLVTTEPVDRASGEDRRWRLSYREHDGTIAELEIHYQATPQPRLQLGHQTHWWTRSEARVEDRPHV